ncbi:MAG: glycosyltransferase [Methylophilales bacterium]|nr:glycosyltransferase [Methylophilales bacterium]
MPKNILLVAKPWRGGLSNYINRALKAFPNSNVNFVSTYPDSPLEYLNYKINKKDWHDKIVNQINDSKYDVALFINSQSSFTNLAHSNKNILWLTDGAKITKNELNRFSGVYLSDLGYLKDLPHRDNFVSGLPFAYDPIVHSPMPSRRKKRFCCSIINKDLNRDEWLKKSNIEGVMPDVYGNYFLRHRLFWRNPSKFHKTLKIYQMGKVYGQYEVSLNIHSSVIMEGTNMRSFECAGYGIAQLIEMKPGLEALLEPEKEFLGFSDIESYVTQFNRLKNDSKLRIKLVENAKKRVAAEHTYQHRINTIFKNL